MSLREICELITYLRAHGVTHFKNGELEIKLEALPHPTSPVASVAPILSPRPISTDKVPESAAAAPPVQMDIIHHANQVASLLKMDDMSLVEALFPDPKQKDGKEA